MADTGKRDDGPSLEMPSFSLRRRKKAPEPAADAPVAAAAPTDPRPTDTRPIEPQPTDTAASGARTTVPPARKVAGPPPRPSRRVRLPEIAGLPAVALTGVVVGGLAVLLAWLAGAGCSAVRGTSSCGGAAGLPLLLAGLVLLAWVGSVLLRALAVPDAGSTSILGVGIMAVLVMVFLLGSLDEWWALVAVPVTAVAGYCVSWWVTASAVGDDTGAEAPEPHDVR